MKLLFVLIGLIVNNWPTVSMLKPSVDITGEELLSRITDYEIVTLQGRKREAAKKSVYFEAFGEQFQLFLDPLEHTVHRNIIPKGLQIQTSNLATILHYSEYYFGFTIFNHTCHGYFDSEDMFHGLIHFSNGTDILFIDSAHDFFPGHKYKSKALVYKLSHISSNPERQRLIKKYKSGNKSKPGPARISQVDHSRSCELSIFVDHLFFERNANSDYQRAVNEVLTFILEMDKLFRSLDLLGNGFPSAIGFKIGSFRVFGREDPHFHFGNDIRNATDYLYAFSRLNFNHSCLGIIFTRRNFTDNLGSAWISTSKNPNMGFCGNRMTFRNTTLSLNTLMVSAFPSAGQTYLTLAHELGHSFGSRHDRLRDINCSPGGDEGNYVMQDNISKMSKFCPNTLKFSPCSVNAIQEQMRLKYTCLKVDPPVCGNQIVEQGEECDCGYRHECGAIQPWCVPVEGSSDQKGCLLRTEVNSTYCVPGEGECCSKTYKIFPPYVQKMCGLTRECSPPGICDGLSSGCPAIGHKDGSPCRNKSGVCHLGLCTNDLSFMRQDGSSWGKNPKYENKYAAISETRANKIALIILVIVCLLSLSIYAAAATGVGRSLCCCCKRRNKYERVSQKDPEGFKDETIPPSPKRFKDATIPPSPKGDKNETISPSPKAVKDETNPPTLEVIKVETIPHSPKAVKYATILPSPNGVKDETIPPTVTGVKDETIPPTVTGVKDETMPPSVTGVKDETIKPTVTGVKDETIQAPATAVKDETIRASSDEVSKF